MNGHPSDALVYDYLDGELTAGEAEDVRHHLTTCEGCRTRLREVCELMEGLRALPTDPVITDTLRLAVRRHVRTGRALPALRRGVIAATIVIGAIVTLRSPRKSDDVDGAARNVIEADLRAAVHVLDQSVTELRQYQQRNIDNPLVRDLLNDAIARQRDVTNQLRAFVAKAEG